ncbi:sulfite exporter TauE/SafE family protein [Candidatus Saccharibacteria bacterium]|nr:sulfite exporter TauE/SafE family protein [Candidatus Saccharibacteria bacterium]
MIELLLSSFLAGVLTVLAPCVASIIPILLTRSGTASKSRNAFFVIGGLSISIIIFSVLLKSSTLLLDIPTYFWEIISGSIVTVFGIFTLFPRIWEEIVLRTRFVFKTQENVSKANQRTGPWADMVLGASLGPVFSACSPTYALIVAIILPSTPATGILYLIAFVLGLALMLSLIALFGSKLLRKLGWGLNPNGAFKRTLGVLLIIVGLLILTGTDKVILGQLVQSGIYDFQIHLESGLLPDL